MSKRDLEAKILSFRQKLKKDKEDMDFIGKAVYDIIISDFDKFFDITTNRFGEIKKDDDYHISPNQLDFNGKLYKDRNNGKK